MTTRRLPDARLALLQLRGCLVLSYVVEPAKKFEIVLDFPDRGAGSDRSFVHCRFHAVRRFTLEAATTSTFRLSSSWYQATPAPPHLEVDSLEVRAAPDRFGVWFRAPYGGLKFEYGSAEVRVRDTKVQRNDQRAIYRDLTSGDVVDFYKPFAG